MTAGDDVEASRAVSSQGPLGLAPGGRVDGRFAPGGSKSLTQRALLLAAVARGRTTLTGLGGGEDVEAALALTGTLGAPCERIDETSVRIHGLPPGPDAGLAAQAPLQVGESGTLARLTTALVALASRPGQRWTIAARGSLLFRRSLPLFDALRRSGITPVRQNLPGTWPVELVSAAPPAALTLVAPTSSQEASGLLLALAAHSGERELTVRGPLPSAPYLAMTRALLRVFGAEVSEQADSGNGLAEEKRVYRVRGPLRAPPEPLAIEPDASSAAVALAAACLSGGALLVPGLTPRSLQGDVRVATHLAAFGCETRLDEEGLYARGTPLRAAELDLAGEPDLAPVLAAVAARAAWSTGGTSTLRGLGTLPGKESDRLGVLATALQGLGLSVEVGLDALRIGPGRDLPTGPHLLEPHGDHRMAFAFALLGLSASGVLVRDPACVAKSWPSFWSDLAALGAEVRRA